MKRTNNSQPIHSHHVVPREIIGHILSFVNQCTIPRFLANLATYYFDVAEAMSYGFFVHPMCRHDGLHDILVAAVHRRRYDLIYLIAFAAMGHDHRHSISTEASYLSGNHIVLYDVLHATVRDRRAYAMIMMVDRVRKAIPPGDAIIALRDYAKVVRSYFGRYHKSLKLVYEDCMYRGDEGAVLDISGIVFTDVATWGIHTFYPPMVESFYESNRGIDVVKKMADGRHIYHISEMKPCCEVGLSVSPCGYVYEDLYMSGSFYDGDNNAREMAIIYRLAIGEDPRDVYEDWEGITPYGGDIAIACIINIYEAYLADEVSVTSDPPMNGVYSLLPEGVMDTWEHPSRRPLPDMTVYPHRNDYRNLRSRFAKAKRYMKG